MGRLIRIEDYLKRKEAEAKLRERYGLGMEELVDDMVRELDEAKDALTQEGK